jgi:hypothetical protein
MFTTAFVLTVTTGGTGVGDIRQSTWEARGGKGAAYCM